MAWPSVYGIDAGRLTGPASSQPANPVILIAHGAFHAAEHFQPLASRLNQAGFRTLLPQLPSSGMTVLPSALEADIAALFNAARPEIDCGRNVVLVAHAYGTIPGCVAADRLNQYAFDKPRAGHVSGHVLLSGVIISSNKSYNDVLQHPWAIGRNNLLALRDPATVFLQDCAPSLRAHHIPLLRPQNASAFSTPVADPAWQTNPTLYVICELDQAIPAHIQRGFVRLLQSANPQARTAVLQSGHCPFVSRIAELLEVITTFASRAV